MSFQRINEAGCIMKTQFVKVSLTSGLLLATILLGATLDLASAAHVAATRGTAEPPFLSLGIKSNLLMLLDNSGSMLDMAHVDPDDSQCFDDSYDPAKTYAGNFEQDSWYVWQEGVAPWKQGVSYTSGRIVYANGGLYKAATSGTSNDTKPRNGYNLSDDTGVVWDAVSQAPTVTTLPASCTDDALTSYENSVYICNSNTWQRLEDGQFLKQEKTDATAVCAAATGVNVVNYNGNNDLCIAVENELLPAAPPLPAITVNKEMKAFAARGNFLNWASASKFDIQKEILTGGKYDSTTGQVIGESRGCAGHGYVKQVSVGTMKLVMRVRGATAEDRVGNLPKDQNTDDTTRIEIIGINATGFNQGACQLVIDKITNNPDTLSQNQIEACLSGTNEVGTSQAALSTSVNVCRQVKETGEVPSLVSTVAAKCESLFTEYGYSPATMSEADGGYACYGIYDSLLLEAERVGYLGRCWDAGNTNCNPKPEVSGQTTNPYCESGTYPNCTTQNIYKNAGGYNYRCIDVRGNAASRYSCKTVNTPADWELLYVDSANALCTPATAGAGYWNPALDPVTKTSDCINRAMLDFCKGLKVPEVIDPSDQATTTTEYWNVPAMMIDGGVLGQMGIAKPLAVMKGYVKQDSPPKGILQSTAGELRIGAMAFNNNGAKTECNPITGNIVEYCPDSNKDGAQVISEITLGSTVTDDKGTADTTDDRTHVDDLSGAINDVRATSWTPLAEAMYNAIGYYTQNTDMRLNTTDFPVGDGHDPVTNWCQSNNILVITEGASTADINAQVKTFVDGPVIVDDNDTEVGTCSNGLDGSTYLDDLTNHAQHATASQLYPTGKSQLQTLDLEWKDKQNIMTYIVASGGLRGSVTDPSECTAARLINDAATNGGSTLYDSASPEQLEEDLLAIFNALRQRASSGSAASVISSSRGGEGAIYQAIFWPELKRTDAAGKEHSIAWSGDVHALFVDSHGFMFEDTNSDHAMNPSAEDINKNGVLDAGEDTNNNGKLDGDKRVVIYFDEVSGKSKACYNTVNWLGTCPDTPVDIQDVKYIWSAAQWLSDSALDTSVNRSPYLSNTKQRYIYTWNDLDNDGIVDRNSEWLSFEAGKDWHSLAGTGRSSVPVDFDVVTADVVSNTDAQDDKVDDIVNWVRGHDRLTAVNLNGNAVTTDDGEAPLRSREIPTTEGSATKVTARLGDIIHSTPMTVSSPAEGYHLIYNDFSYAQFVKKYKNRRHVIYFGSNDGMLHAVNGGCYEEQEHKFYTSVDADGKCVDDDSKPVLGAELWAYVPYNLLPHLSSLTNPDYVHKYFADLRPRIFDVQIFPNEDPNDPNSTHPNGWGTILVGGMRLGGAPINAGELNNASADDIRQFISSYFIFDITDPEQPPVLLGEMTRRQGAVDTDLGHSLAIPTMVIMNDKTVPEPRPPEKNQWYLVFGSGPHAAIGSNDAMKGISDQSAKLAVLPLDWLVKTPTALRIPAAPPTAAPPTPTDVGGTIVLPGSSKGFTSDLITIDGDINPTSISYMADAVYFGTNEGDYPGFKGQIYRLMTRNKVGANYRFGNTITQEITTPDQWELTTLMDVGQPVNAAPSVGYDGYNFWLYVGTGRFFHGDDRMDATQQSFYGIKEPMELITPSLPEKPYMKFLGGEVDAPTAAAHGDTSASRSWPIETAVPGSKGLLKVDEIRVAEADTPSLAALSCRGSNTLDCIPDSMVSASKTTLADLIHYIADPDPATGNTNLYNSTDGWYVDYSPYANRERNLGQATLFGGLVTFTTYQPFLDPCQAEGRAFLYTVYYQTGTAWHEAIFGANGLYNEGTVREKMDLGRGLSTTPNLHVSGDGNSVTAMVQTSTGVIVEQQMDEMATGDYFTGRTGWKECTE